MNIKQGQSLMDEINRLIDADDYSVAKNKAKKLLHIAEKNGWQHLCSSALSFLLAFAIENNDVEEGNILAGKLAKQPPTAYGMFLQSRLLMLQSKNKEALDKGWEALDFANKHPDITAPTMLEKIYNVLGKLLSDYGDHKRAIEFDLLAMKAAADLDLKALNYSNYLFNLHFLHNDPEEYYKAHVGYNELFKDIRWYDHEHKYQLEAITKKPVGKIRIGYISPDLRKHVVLRFSWAMFTNYDKNKYEVYCYHNSPVEDDYSEEIKAMTDCWRNISGMNAAAAAEVIYKDNIDILVDLAGHTQRNPLPIMAYKPAPVQISGIGYFATTGLKAIDYFLSDKLLQSEPQYFSEDIIELDHSHFCYAPLYEAPAAGEAPCIKNDYITFGSFNHIRKITDEVLELWVDIIKAVPNSHLLLKGLVFDDSYGYKLFCDRLVKFDIDMESPEWQQRIELRGFSTDYLAEYGDMDIALDTFPYPGGGTTCDALYMGVPVITLIGNSHGERFGKSLLENIGLSEFVTYNKQSYFDLAVALAGNMEIIRNLHVGLRHMMEKSPLMNRNLYMQELESAYKAVWQKYIDTLPKVECPTAKEALNNSFNYYKGKGYERAEGWCRLALMKDQEHKYLLEAKSLLSDILQDKLDYVEAWQLSKETLDMLEQEKDKGTKEFQHRLWLNYASRSLKLGFIDEAAEAYDESADIVDDGYKKFSLKGSALQSLLCKTEDCAEVKRRLKEIDELRDKGTGYLTNKVSKAKKTHIAYISPDFRQHVMFSFYYTMLHGYDHDKFKVTCISLTEKADGYTEHLKTLVDNWIDVSKMSWPETISRLKKKKIDILVDLAGHSADSGLPIFYDRVAPVQISGLGWMESTGLSCTDYLITDRYIDPDLSNITEQPLYLASQFCYTGRNDVPTPQGAPCKDKAYVTFGVFNHYHKWTDEMLLAWKEVMERVPNSRLLLKCQLLVSESACAMVMERLQTLGFDLDRVELEAATNTYMCRYLDVDIALDTYPYPGGGTTCDALYMGVPVVTRYGQRRGSRFGLSILNNTGLGELAVDNVHDYIERAVGLANDVELLDVLHKNLRNMMNSSPIMDSKKYIKELENAYSAIFAGK